VDYFSHDGYIEGTEMSNRIADLWRAEFPAEADAMRDSDGELDYPRPEQIRAVHILTIRH